MELFALCWFDDGMFAKKNVVLSKPNLIPVDFILTSFRCKLFLLSQKNENVTYT